MSQQSVPEKGPITRNDVFQSFLRWLFFSHANYNWERYQGTGFAHAMAPIIKKLYKDPEDIKAALKRHLVFFNTEPDTGGVIHGMVIAMEEKRAMGVADIDDERIIDGWRMDPVAIRRHHFQAANVRVRLQDGDAAVVRMRTGT